VDSSLNCSATLVLCDLYKRYFRQSAGERESMIVLYVTTLTWGAIGTVTALAMIRVRSTLDVWWQLAGIFSGGMLGLFLLGLISRRAKNAAAATAVVSGILVILWMTLSASPVWPEALEPLRTPFHSLMIVVNGTLTILLVGLLLSRFGRPRSNGEERTSDTRE
ncbi:MAG: sodium:solute symporter, partial [Planctomycetota bacterium]